MDTDTHQQAAGSSGSGARLSRFASASTCASNTATTFPETLHHVKQRLQKPPQDCDDVGQDQTALSNDAESVDVKQCNEDTEQLALLPSTTGVSLQVIHPAAGSLDPRSGAQLRHTDSMDEVWNENEAGLSWGEKRSHDQTWEERWLQQRVVRRTSDPDVNREVVFGKSSGVNKSLNQRWTASWETEVDPVPPAQNEERESPTFKRIVKKVVVQYDPTMSTQVEHWNELYEEQSLPENSERPWTRRVNVVKSGHDKNTGRSWKSDCEDLYDGTEKNENLLTKTETFVETTANVTRQRTSVTDVNGTVVTKTVTTKADDSSKENCVQGQSTETRANGDVHEKRWETREVPVQGETCFEKVTYKEESTKESNGNSWGNKCTKREVYAILDKPSASVSASSSSQLQDETHQSIRLLSVEDVRERWYDNTSERLVDHRTTKREFDEYNPNCAVTQIDRGNKQANRYSDGTSWGETWGRNWHKAEKVDAALSHLEQNNQRRKDTGNFPVDAVQRTDQPDSDPDAAEPLDYESPPGLVLGSNFYDKWWREPSGNTWGEKRYVEDQTEHHERWYRNNDEEQVDRWKLTEFGKRTGTKSGKKLDGTCEWHEKWEADDRPESSSTNTNYWIDKHWKKQLEDGRMVMWGEVSGQEGQRHWKEKWNKDDNPQNGHQRVEKYHNDGCGNFETYKEGSDWTGGTIVNWFTDRYGECLSRSEKWAVKEGRNAEGSVWQEKWNELPDRKCAEKTGTNQSGHVWREAWNEIVSDEGKTKKTWAEKTGKNNQGDEWFETWTEEDGKKRAKKKGQNNNEEWEEEWGEETRDDGTGEKWTSKWARDRKTGSAKGQSWGDRWSLEGGHHWGDIWDNDHVEKWWRDTDGRPEGC